jgi:hypothetical protein
MQVDEIRNEARVNQADTLLKTCLSVLVASAVFAEILHSHTLCHCFIILFINAKTIS